MKAINFSVEPSKSALIIIDMQNDFVRQGAAAYVPGAKATIPNIRKLADVCRKKGIPVIYTRYFAPPVRTTWTEFAKALADPPKNLLLKGLKRHYSDVNKKLDVNDVVDELAPKKGDYTVDKHWYDGFFDTPLESYMKARGIKYAIITGTATEVCVEATTKGAYHRQFYPVVVSDGISPFDPEAAQVVLKLLAKRWAMIVTTDQIIEKLARKRLKR